jgi:hypothetical protein
VLELEPERRRLVIAHEREHVRARDTALLALGAVLLVLMPWNAPIWWQMRRLRGAIEFDCDARVLHGGHDVGRYTTLLVDVGVRRSVPSMAFAALSESKTLLERRIRAMLTPRPRYSNAALAASSVLALALLVGACEAPQPTTPPIRPQATTEAARPGEPGVDGRVTINRISALPAGDGDPAVIVLQVKAGPSYLVNGVGVPVAELESFVTDLYAPRPRKVLFVRADAGVADGDLTAAVQAARAGLSAALEIEKQHGLPGESAEINVIATPTSAAFSAEPARTFFVPDSMFPRTSDVRAMVQRRHPDISANGLPRDRALWVAIDREGAIRKSWVGPNLYIRFTGDDPGPEAGTPVGSPERMRAQAERERVQETILRENVPDLEIRSGLFTTVNRVAPGEYGLVMHFVTESPGFQERPDRFPYAGSVVRRVLHAAATGPSTGME